MTEVSQRSQTSTQVKKSASSRKRSKHKQSSVSLVKESKVDNILSQIWPKVESQEEILHQFFDTFLDAIITQYDENDIDPEIVEPVEQELTGTYSKNFKSLNFEDLIRSDVMSVSGSNVILKTKSKSNEKHVSGLMPKKIVSLPSLSNIKPSDLDGAQTKSALSTRKTSTTSSHKSTSSSHKIKLARIVFSNGNIYDGEVAVRTMHGTGTYSWSDGSIYQGQFIDGFPTGQGIMILPDLSKYEGQICQGLFHGYGVLNIVATPKIYAGEWNHGKKEGKGWLLYDAHNWYDGRWLDDLKHDVGLRYYTNGTKYKGRWLCGERDCYGEMLWSNNDYYRGEWQNGELNGFGAYTWNAFFNNTFTFPIQNTYRGFWKNGKRWGTGEMHFGAYTGGKIRGMWIADQKDGPAVITSGNRKIIEKVVTFTCDKLPQSETDGPMDVPIFLVPEMVDLDYYISITLRKLQLDCDSEKLAILKEFERRHLENTITQYLPQLDELYDKYASFPAQCKLHFRPVMVKMFLWQLYKDMEISKLGFSLVDVDEILASNPSCCIEKLHYPFEPIYFWQFLMSIVGVALSTEIHQSLSDFSQGGITAFIVGNFLRQFLFGPSLLKEPSPMKYKNLVPIQAVYLLYLELGEPHTVRDFLRRTCVKKRSKLSCLETSRNLFKPARGYNVVPLNDDLVFIESGPISEAISDHMSLSEFRHLGSQTIMNCIAQECPLVFSEGLMSNMNYPLVFLEFYDVLLACIFSKIEMNLIKEKSKLERMSQQDNPPQMTLSEELTAKRSKSERKKKQSK